VISILRRHKGHLPQYITEPHGILAWSGVFLYTHPEMAITITPPDISRIRSIAEQIGRMFSPRRIILFGSCATGSTTDESDADLLILVDGGEPALGLAARINASIDHPFPIDILVWQLTQFEESLDRGGSFATEVARNGIVLHEA
jgi:predicted nucleotidyltransferase